VETCIVGGAISGYSATGRDFKVTSPEITIIIEITAAKMGRFIKKLLNIFSSS
jgi:hypothetical protein